MDFRDVSNTLANTLEIITNTLRQNQLVLMQNQHDHTLVALYNHNMGILNQLEAFKPQLVAMVAEAEKDTAVTQEQADLNIGKISKRAEVLAAREARRKAAEDTEKPKTQVVYTEDGPVEYELEA